jgi:hypothetical protein
VLTVVSVPARHYAGGFAVTVDGAEVVGERCAAADVAPHPVRPM